MAKEVTQKKILTGIYDLLYARFGSQQWWPGDTAFEISVGAILTQNTNWGNVEKAIHNLKREKVLNARALHTMSRKRLASFIRPAGYFNVKAGRLKHFVAFLWDQYQGKMDLIGVGETDALRRQLLEVHGIGPETADSILLYALHRPVFVIDAYTRRILHRHGLVSERAEYHELQALFHGSLTADVRLYNEFHALFVKLGKEFCRPKSVCSGCPLEKI